MSATTASITTARAVAAVTRPAPPPLVLDAAEGRNHDRAGLWLLAVRAAAASTLWHRLAEHRLPREPRGEVEGGAWERVRVEATRAELRASLATLPTGDVLVSRLDDGPA